MSSETPASGGGSGSSSSSSYVSDNVSMSSSLETAIDYPPPNPYCIDIPTPPPPPGTEEEVQWDGQNVPPTLSTISPLYANYSQHAYYHATAPPSYSQRNHPGYPYSYYSQLSPYAQYSQSFYQADPYLHFYQTAPYPSFSQTTPSQDYSQPAPYQSFSVATAPTAVYSRSRYYQAGPSTSYSLAGLLTSYSQASSLASYSQVVTSAASYTQASSSASYSQAGPSTNYSEADLLTSHSQAEPSTSYTEARPSSAGEPEAGASSSEPQAGPSSGEPQAGPSSGEPQADPSTSSLSNFRVNPVFWLSPRQYPQYSQTYTVKVHNINYRTTLETLRYCFRPFGALGDLIIARDPVTEASKGYAFIRYYDRRHAVNAANSMTGITLEGRELRAEVLAPDHPEASRILSFQPASPDAPTRYFTLKVTNINFRVTANMLKRRLERTGTVSYINMPLRRSGLNKGYAYVRFAKTRQAARCISKLNNTRFEGRRLIIRQSSSRPATSSSDDSN